MAESTASTRAWAGYLAWELEFHLRHHFQPEVQAMWRSARVMWAPRALLLEDRAHDVLIPTDMTPRGPTRVATPTSADLDPQLDAWKVPFNGTELTLWSRIPQPGGWTSWPSDQAPIWHLRSDGAAMPAWDLFGNLRRLLSLQEEVESPQRDEHRRFIAHFSPRCSTGLLEVPAFNEAAAALAGLLVGRHSGRRDALDRLGSLLQPPGVILSHDLDLLRGNDAITQSIRAYRSLRPLLRGRPPSWRGFKAMVANHREPRRRYLDVIAEVVEAERAAGARSSFYFLNGSGGRFGARSGPADIPRARRMVPPEWSVGMHYNHDTLLNERKFGAQRAELEGLIGGTVEGGRAHYLRFDPERSYAFLEEQGLRYDESVGFPDQVGYRAGVAGAYHPPRPGTADAMQLLEIPLAVMDVTLERQYPAAIEATLVRLLRHLRAIGGSLSMLVHLEAIGHPDLDEDRFQYGRLLGTLRDEGARFLLPNDFLRDGTATSIMEDPAPR